MNDPGDEETLLIFSDSRLPVETGRTADDVGTEDGPADEAVAQVLSLSSGKNTGS